MGIKDKQRIDFTVKAVDVLGLEFHSRVRKPRSNATVRNIRENNQVGGCHKVKKLYGAKILMNIFFLFSFYIFLFLPLLCFSLSSTLNK